MNLAIQITAIDMLSSVVERVKHSILSMGTASNKVKRDFDVMTTSITRGLKAIAVASYAWQKMMPGVKSAGNLQEAMLQVKSNLISSAKDAKDLDNSLRSVKKSAIDIAANAPFSAEDVVRIEGALLKAGVAMDAVVAKKGAGWAATALATLTGEAPELIGDSLSRIGDMFNFEGAQYGQFADWVSRVDDASATKVPELIAGLRMAGSTAAALRISATDAVTALGVLAPLGERAGSSYSNFLLSIATKAKELKASNIKLFEKGQFIGMERAIDVLKSKFGAIKDDQKRLNILTKIFGEEGGRAANQFINSKKGFKDLNDEAKKAADLEKKLSVWAEGFNASVKKLAGTAATTLASIFDPILKPLRAMLDMLNEITAKMGEFFEKHKSAAAVVSGVGLAGAGGAMLYGLYSLTKGGLAGGRVLKGLGGIKGLLKGFGGTAAGIAEGKAVQAATGVQPVFVTNWPPGGNFAAVSTDAVGTKIGSGLAAGILKGSAAAAIGFAIGTAINEGLSSVITRATDGKSNNLGELLYSRSSHAYASQLRQNYLDKLSSDLMAAKRAGDKERMQDIRNEINIALNVDQNGRPIVSVDDMKTNVKANIRTMNHGEFGVPTK
jgi:TP901 family phage tail tape measure protein